ncbi:putative glycolipid-binding domain-containing protein [Actinokineospora auranticolor]|uniref:Glycolipid-binding protein n=1 Tax=Actinokineospora auranticolor TaxID=155976 RepID=A0A2S6GKX1_9PSEU|nr:putative glycolipid-binding domain-containing protein [Actinokineospora auranticolor]PPK65894.1 hypothetical protein CLV40_112159 [Actinokineospora auranticolor]
MSTDATTDRVLAEGGGRPRNPSVFTWQGSRPATLESVRLLLTEGRLRASGRLIAAAHPDTGREAFSASFDASFNDAARGAEAGRLLLRTTAAQERQVSVNRTEDGTWLVDHGDASRREEFDGALTIDVAGMVTLSALPIRRLGLHRQTGEHELPVVYVSMPELEVQVVRQRYRTVSVDERGAVIEFTQGEVTTELTVDADGVVVEYPGVASRV